MTPATRVTAACFYLLLSTPFLCRNELAKNEKLNAEGRASASVWSVIPRTVVKTPPMPRRFRLLGGTLENTRDLVFILRGWEIGRG